MKLKILAIGIILMLIGGTFVATAKLNDIVSKEKGNTLKNIKFELKMRVLARLSGSPSLSTCIIKNDSVVWFGSYGFSNVYQLKRPNKDTIYMVSSVTKTITATALLQLYEQGYFNLDDNVSKWLPFDLKNPKYPQTNITFRMLLYHRSSIYDYCVYGLVGMLDTIRKHPFKYETGDLLKEMLVPGGKLYNSKFWYDFPPDTNSVYSNIGYLIIGYLIEKISGKTIEDYCQENIFGPLDMKNTSYHPENLNEKQMARPYTRPSLTPIPLPNFDHGCFGPMCGVRTSAEDLSHFMIAHMNNGTYEGNRILKDETVELMHTILYPESNALSSLNYHKRNYGMAWFSVEWYGEETEGHGGQNPGGMAFMMTNESDKIGFIILSNGMDILEFYKPKLLIKFNIINRIGESLLQEARDI